MRFVRGERTPTRALGRESAAHPAIQLNVNSPPGRRVSQKVFALRPPLPKPSSGGRGAFATFSPTQGLTPIQTHAQPFRQYPDMRLTHHGVMVTGHHMNIHRAVRIATLAPVGLSFEGSPQPFHLETGRGFGQRIRGDKKGDRNQWDSLRDVTGPAVRLEGLDQSGQLLFGNRPVIDTGDIRCPLRLVPIQADRPVQRFFAQQPFDGRQGSIEEVQLRGGLQLPEIGQ